MGAHFDLSLLALLLLAFCCSSSSAAHAGADCNVRLGDDFIAELARGTERIADAHTSHAVMDQIVDNVFRVNQFEEPPRPIALVLFGQEGTGIDVAERLIVDSLLRTDGLEELAHPGYAEIDVSKLSAQSIGEAKETMRKQIKSAVTACPQKSVVVLKSAEAMQADRVQLLDVLLTPLANPKRPMLDGIDCHGLVVLLLMAVKPSSVSDLKASLEKHWEYQGPEFTTGAMVGRITDVFAFPELSPEEKASLKQMANTGLEERRAANQKWEAERASTKAAVPEEEGGSSSAPMALLVLIGAIAVATGSGALTGGAQPTKKPAVSREVDVSPPKFQLNSKGGVSGDKPAASAAPGPALGRRRPAAAKGGAGSRRDRSKTPVGKSAGGGGRRR